MGKAIARKNSRDISYFQFYDEFVKRCNIDGLSDYTIKFYENSLKAFEEFLEVNNIKLMAEINESIYENYILFLQNKSTINDTTVSTYLRAVKAFLRYAMKKEYTQEFEIKVTKAGEKNKPTYSEEDIVKLIKKPNLKTCSFTEYRNWVMVQYLLETGNRVNTVINIKVKDVDLSNGMVLLNITKSHKQMYFPIGQVMAKVLHQYINDWGLEDADWLFPNYHRGQLTRGAMADSIRNYNLNRGVQITSAHSFRHTFAKNYVKLNGNAFKLQRLLAHSTLKVTQEYVNLFGDDLKEDFEDYSIIERLGKSKKIKRIIQ